MPAVFRHAHNNDTQALHCVSLHTKLKTLYTHISSIRIMIHSKVHASTCEKGVMGFEGPSGELHVCREQRESTTADRLQS